MASGNARTVPEWESEIGRQVRDLRLRRNQTQVDLARVASVSVSTLAALERGAGSSLSTLIAVVRALGRSDWLDALAPTEPISPLALLEEQRRGERRVRRRASGRGTSWP
jgi:transcriptional regulator with XRE-family HTH domain